jgi:hypothetical protein
MGEYERWICVKSVKSLTSELGKMTLDSASTPPKKKRPKVHAVVSSPPAADSKGPPPTKKPYFKGGDNKKGADNKGKGGGGGPKADGYKGKGSGKDGYKKTKKAYFVRSWPENTPYLSKNGNCLSKEIEKHFADFCHKCGHSSHNAAQCLTYKDKGQFSPFVPSADRVSMIRAGLGGRICKMKKS